MSLYKQLWFAICFLMALAFSGSFVVSSLSAKAYLEEQLYIKNLDNANSLALSLSQPAIDDVAMELMLSSQFDNGYYQFIRLIDPEGNIILELIDQQNIKEAPEWFMALFPFDVKQGSAKIQQGWQQRATLNLKSQERFAYHELWQSTQRLLGYFLVTVIFSGLLGTWILRRITSPLGAVVNQAQAIGERRFITIPEAGTLEFRALVQSMNKLSLRIKNMLKEESQRLELWRQKVQFDEVTGLFNRDELLALVTTTTERDDETASGSFIIIRIKDLSRLNRTQGRSVMDALLKKYGQTLTGAVSAQANWACGRLNGSDFAILTPAENNTAHIAQTLQQLLLNVTKELGLENTVALHCGATHYQPGEHISQLLSRVDTELIAIEADTGSSLSISTDPKLPGGHDNIQLWQEQLAQAFDQRAFQLTTFPVTTMDGELIHQEAFAKLSLEGKSPLSAGQFIPWINRFGWEKRLDELVFSLAQNKLQQEREELCINLSSAILSDAGYIQDIAQQISSKPELATKLWLEIPEYSVFQHMDGFRAICQQLKPLGCRIGIEHAGHEIGRLGELHDLGVDYIKIDGAIIRGVEQRPANQTLLRGLCTIIHSIGLIAIAEGVQNQEEWKTLKTLGIDGATGPAVNHSSKE